MILKKSTNVRQFIELSQYYDMVTTIEEVSSLEVPKTVGRYSVPQTLDEITFGLRLDLSEVNVDADFLFKPLELLAGFTRDEILLLKFTEVVRFGQFVMSELKRFNKRDEKNLKYHFDDEELKAGVKQVNHGVFGLIDVIAKRMNITHDDVLELSQLKVYMMLKIDIDNSNYQKKLRDIFNKQN
ncbi:MAG: hypothetical protein ACOYLE_09620 [Bacteroidales bacterium]